MKKPTRVHKRILTACIVVLAVLLPILTAALVLHGYIRKINLVSPGGSIVLNTSSVPDDESGDGSGKDSPSEDVASLEEQIYLNLKKNGSQLAYDNDVFNVLLIGSDTRVQGAAGRSDTMILVSVNKKTRTIVSTSLLRDIYLAIPGCGNDRLNAAYAYGGANLLMKTVNQNFKVKVDRYAAMDFLSFVSLVDQVGGVTLTISGSDVPVLNGYLWEINRLEGSPEGSDYFSSGGTYLFDGKQALAYVRNRYTGDGDFGRTARQREVLGKVLDKMKGMSLSRLNGLLNSMLPQITTNLSEGELFSLILSLPAYSKYNTQQWSIPEKGTFSYLRIDGKAVLGIQFQKNIADLQRRVYGKTS